MTNQYTVGTLVRITAAIVAAGSDTPIDPSTITCKVKQPDGTVVDLTGSIVHDGTGLYHVDYTVPLTGAYSYEWITTGAVVVSAVNNFIVNQGVF